MSFGASVSKSGSQNTSEATSESTQSSASSSSQDIAFKDLFQQLYGGATGAAGRAVAGADQLGKTAQQLFSGGTDFISSLGNDAGTGYLKQRLDAGDAVQNQQLDVLREQTGRLFSENINPAISSNAIASGSLGGGRQAVEQALGAERAASVFNQGATSILSNNQQQKDAAAAQVMQGSLQSASTGLGGLGGLFDLASKGNNSELGIYGLLGSILGGPTTLTSSSSSSLAKAFSEAFSQGTSKSSSYGASIGV